MIHPNRIEQLNTNMVRPGGYVVYWMQASQRTLDNHAFEYAVRKANDLSQPLLVFFGLTSDFPEANERHYLFMLQGLQETAKTLENRGIPFIIQQVSPEKGVVLLSKNASLVVTDKGYLRIQRHWRQYAAQHLRCPLIQVESDAIVPIATASHKEEYAATTLRPKIKKQLNTFLHPLQTHDLQTQLHHNSFDSLDLSNLSYILSHLPIDHHIKPSTVFHGGTSHALLLLQQFIHQKLPYFSEFRNDPSKEYCSHMSPYLHFGQISPLTIVLRLLRENDQNTDAYLEELIIRRELSMNYVSYNTSYDSYEGIPPWAKQTLLSHAKDKRPYLYTKTELEAADTHDPYWNAAQQELINTGKMQGYMRMYWGKKILEWTQNPKEAFDIALFLNNKYELDGRDPNGFTGVAWCFGKHDRAWQERPIFGKVRYMNAAGLLKKFDMDGYMKKLGLL